MPDAGVITHSPDEIRASRQWAGFYRERGYNPLPSRPDDKRPFVRFARYWETPVPPGQFDRFNTANIQLMLGRSWGLIAIDLDGPEAIAHWATVCPCRLRTWITHSGGHGSHLWFSVPYEGPPILSGRLWGVWEPEANRWRKHVAIEILGDRRLLMAPPSIHPRTGRKYRFLHGQSPLDFARPMLAPSWLWQLPILTTPRRPVPDFRVIRKPPVSLSGTRYDRQAVLDAITDKASLAASWGLRFASAATNQDGWHYVHAVEREDINPSAGFHAESGRYWEPGEKAISLFDLAVRLGIYGDWREAVSDLGDRFHV
jgi:hypothetical protein